MNGLVLGLDIGIASVGVGILEKILERLSMRILVFFQLQQLIIMLKEEKIDRLDDYIVGKNTVVFALRIYLKTMVF